MKSIAIASAKGGVGKTNLSAAIAISLANLEAKVLLIDGDLGLANIDILLNIKPTVTLKHVVCDAVDPKSAVTPGPEGIAVVCGGSGVKELATIEPEVVKEIVKSLEYCGKEYDYVIFDTGSGIGDSTMTLLESVERVVVVCTPDPTSIMDAYATAKILFEKKPGADVALLVNMADDERSGHVVYARFKSIIGQFLNKEVTLAGIVPYDKAVKDATRARTSFMTASPHCKAAKKVAEIADRITEETVEHEESPGLALLQRARSIFQFMQRFKKKAAEPEPKPEKRPDPRDRAA